MKTNIHIWSYLVQFFFRKLDIFRTKAVEKLKTYILYSITFFSKTVPFVRQFAKLLRSRAGQGDSMTHARCVLDN